MKIAIVDKNKQSRELLKNALLNLHINFEITHESEDFKENYNDTNLLFFDVNSNELEEIISKIKTIKQKNNKIILIALSYEIKSSLVTKILSQGANDFILKPIIPSILEASINKLNYNKEKKAKTICVFSSKGGIGKTSTAINLGYELSQKTQDKICILDLSFNSQDASNFLNVEQKYDLNYILSDIETSKKEVVLSLIPNYQNSNLYILEAKEEIMSEAKYTPQKIIKIINLLKNIFDFIIIDTTNSINEQNVAIFNSSDLILFLCSTSIASIKNCEKCYELFDKINYDSDRIKLIVNRYIENEQLSELKHEIFVKIPNNYLTLIDAINQGKCVGEINPQSNIAKAYAKLAQNIIDLDFANMNLKSNQNHGIFNLLRRMGEE